MENFKLSFALAFMAVFLWSAAIKAETPPTLQCKTGPINRTYGDTDWLLYSCDDGRSLAFFAASGNPAAPAYYVIKPQDDGHYHLVGKSNGDVAASNAAVKDIQGLTKDSVAQLIASTKGGGK
jgi:hypothetical protein